MAKKAKRKEEPKREPPQLKRLRTRVRNLEAKLSDSVPKLDLEALRASLDARVSELQAELARSVPKSDADSLNARIGELKTRLAESVPKKQLQEASGRVSELETQSQAVEARNGELESQVRGLKSKVQEVELEESSQKREVEALKERVTEAETRERERIENIETVMRRARYRKQDERYWLSNEDWQELRGLITPLSGEGAMSGREHRFEASGSCAGCGVTERYLGDALSVLQTWPEDSEKKERMAELKTCRNDLFGKGADAAAPQFPLPTETELQP